MTFNVTLKNIQLFVPPTNSIYTYFQFFSMNNGIIKLTIMCFVGSSESSEVIVARTKGRAPEAPPQFQFITSNSSQATLYLTQWKVGGCPITHFLVQYKKHGKQMHWTTGTEGGRVSDVFGREERIESSLFFLSLFALLSFKVRQTHVVTQSAENAWNSVL